MSASLTKKSTDHSSRDYFMFSFHCDRCGRSWTTNPVGFAGGGCSDIENDEVRNILWAQEHHIAYERANLEAQFHFNHCPICGRWVCDDCFYPLASADYDLCRDCQAKLTNTRP